MKRMLALLMVAVMAAGTLTGCSKSEPESTAAADTTAADTTAAEVTDAAETTTDASAENTTEAKPADPSAKKDTLVVIGSMDPDTMDPYGSSLNNLVLFRQLYDTLLLFDDDGGLAPCLAESWEESEDGTYYTYKLRQGVKFHDGSDFNAECVKFTVDTMLASTGMAWGATYVKGAEVVDDYTVKLFKGTAYAAMNEFLINYLHIVSPTAYTANDPGKFPVGTGAYKFVEWGNDNCIRLTKNDDYFMGAAHIPNVLIKPTLEAATAVISLQNGEADLVCSMPLEQKSVIENDPKLKYVISDGWSQDTIVMMGEDYMNDQNLRKAIYYAVNRDNAAAFNNYPEDYVPATNILAARLMGDHAGFMDIEGYDPEKAAEYLAKSDYDGRELPITVQSSEVNLAQSVQADLAAIGINSKINQLETAAYYDAYVTGVSGLYFGGWGCNYASTEDQLTYHAGHGFYGKWLYNNEEYDKCLQDAAEIYVAADRKELTERALYLAWDFANMVPLYETLMMYVYNADLTGFKDLWAATYQFRLGEVDFAN